MFVREVLDAESEERKSNRNSALRHSNRETAGNDERTGVTTERYLQYKAPYLLRIEAGGGAFFCTKFTRMAVFGFSVRQNLPYHPGMW